MSASVPLRRAAFWVAAGLSFAAVGACAAGVVFMQRSKLLYVFLIVPAIVVGAWMPSPSELLVEPPIQFRCNCATPVGSAKKWANESDYSVV